MTLLHFGERDGNKEEKKSSDLSARLSPEDFFKSSTGQASCLVIGCTCHFLYFSESGTRQSCHFEGRDGHFIRGVLSALLANAYPEQRC